MSWIWLDLGSRERAGSDGLISKTAFNHFFVFPMSLMLKIISSVSKGHPKTNTEHLNIYFISKPSWIYLHNIFIFQDDLETRYKELEKEHENVKKVSKTLEEKNKSLESELREARDNADLLDCPPAVTTLTGIVLCPDVDSLQ